MKILADATLPNVMKMFDSSFKLTLYNTVEQVPELLTDHEILVCRSTLKVTAQCLARSKIQCVATASSGTDHIDCDYLKQHRIKLFDAKGSNARAVADYVIATLAWLTQNKKPFERRAGVIGMGAVGSQVTTRLKAAGFEVLCFDPLKEGFHSCDINELATCSLLCIHANLHETVPFASKQLINAHFLTQLKSNVIIINAARGGIVDEDALLKVDKPIIYCTDVYCTEPAIDKRIIDLATLCTPHIAGHSIEAKKMAVVQLSQQLHCYFGRPVPLSIATKPSSGPILPPQFNWQDAALLLFNPFEDTIKLKTGADISHAFLSQRKAHQKRHDFNFYNGTQLDPQIRLILGMDIAF